MFGPYRCVNTIGLLFVFVILTVVIKLRQPPTTLINFQQKRNWIYIFLLSQNHLLTTVTKQSLTNLVSWYKFCKCINFHICIFSGFFLFWDWFLVFRKGKVKFSMVDNSCFVWNYSQIQFKYKISPCCCTNTFLLYCHNN